MPLIDGTMSSSVPIQMAFSIPTPLSSTPRPFHSSSPRRFITIQSSAKPRKATLHSTGKRISLQPAPTPSPSNPSLQTLYILCPSCSTAYVGNAITSEQQVRCPKCTHTFTATPKTLYQLRSQNPPPEQRPQKPNTISCVHFPSCPGCTLDTSVNDPPILHEARHFFRTLGLKHLQVKHADSHNWRTHAKLAVRQIASSPSLGLFKVRSHELVTIPNCVVHADEINQAAAAVTAVLKRTSVTPYNDFTGRGHCRYLLFTIHRPSRKVQVTFVWNASSWKDANPLAQRVGGMLWRLYPALIHSVWFNWNTSTGNAIVTPGRDRFYHMHGPVQLADSVCGVEVYFPPYAFRQANLDAFETLLMPELLRYIPIGSSVAEFCAGVGVIGLVALKMKKLRSLVASEINEGAEESFWKSVKGIREGMVTGDVDYVVGSDEDCMDTLQGADVVIVDPPRAGLSERLVERLAKGGSARRIVYVSCGFAGFKRDARMLCDGVWNVKAAHAVILFPGSDHVEIIGIFDKRDPDE